MARDAGAKNVYLASAAPPVKFPNVYGIDMPSRNELLAHNKTYDEIIDEIGADALIYQDLDDLKLTITQETTAIKDFDCSCFDGKYITADIDEAYLANIENARADKDGDNESIPSSQLDLNLLNYSSENEEQHA